jgi:hypothetical protein
MPLVCLFAAARQTQQTFNTAMLVYPRTIVRKPAPQGRYLHDSLGNAHFFPASVMLLALSGHSCLRVAGG